MSSGWRKIFALLGIALCAFLAWKADWQAIGAEMAKLGYRAPLVFIPYFVVYALDTLGWRFALDPRVSATLRFPTLFRIRWCGESLNTVMPSAYVGGEALKVMLLKSLGVDTRESTAAAIISKSVQTLAQVLFLAAGAWSFMHLTEPGSDIRRGMTVVMVGSLLVVTLMFTVQRLGIFRVLRRTLHLLHLHPRVLDEKREAHDQIDRTIMDFYRHQPRRFVLCLAAYLGGWLCDTLEIWLVATLLGTSMSWPQALAVEAFIGVAKIMGLFIPGALGIQESGILLIGVAAGLPKPFCYAYAVIRRVRELLFASAGWMLISFLPSRGSMPSPKLNDS